MINQGQSYHHPYDRHTTIVVCREHADTSRRTLGAVQSARLAGSCEVCCEDEARETLSRMRQGSVLLRTVKRVVLDQLIGRRLAVEMTSGLIDPTPAAAAYCATPDLFDWSPDVQAHDGDDD